MKIFTSISFAFLLSVTVAQIYAQKASDIFPTDAVQIKLAMKAAPADKAEGAKVLGYNKNNELVVLREGSNDLICIGDDPAKKDIHVACYFQELEPLMARGRELTAEGKSSPEREKIRGQEADAGILKLPQKPATLFVFDASQDEVDLNTGEVGEGRLRSVIYVPYLTGEESGLPTKPIGGGMPWLMDAGSYKAHIMITPPKPK